MRPLEEELFKDGLQFAAQHFPRTGMHDRAILTYLYARRRIGVAVKGPAYRLKDPLPPDAEQALEPFRNFVRFVEAKRDGVKYRPDQLRVPAGNPDGGQWTDEGGGGGDKPANRPLLAWTPPAGTVSDAPMPIGQVGFSEAERKMTAQQFISENCVASIYGVFPSEFLDLTIGQIEAMPHSQKTGRCLKLLKRPEYRK